MIPHSRPEISSVDIAAVVKALKNVRLSQGYEVLALEDTLGKMFGDCEAVVVSSGTAALYLALAALGAGRGDKVVIPSYTCNSLFSAVSFTGAKAVCADTAKGTLNIGRDTVKAVMDRSVKAVIVPHTCGYLADVPAIAGLKVPVIEDCAQAVGGRYADGSPVGSKGDIAVLSFYATKLIPGGEGGACLTRNRDLAEMIRKLRDCDKQAPDSRAFNFKMTDICAALARSKLKDLSKNVKERAAIAAKFDKAFGTGSFRIKSSSKQAVCFRYVLDVPGRADEFLDRAASAGIACMRPIWRPLHYTLGGKCPNTERLHRSLVSVPLYPSLKSGEIGKICQLVAITQAIK